MTTASGYLRFSVLGPVEAFRDGRRCTPSAAKPRALLALLLMHPNEPLSTERIVDELWGSAPPRSAIAALQMYVTSVRRAVLPVSQPDARRHPVLRTMPSGYLIRVQPHQLDLAEFRMLTRRGRTSLAVGHCAQAGHYFRQALALWRGSALSDLSRCGSLRQYAASMEEERAAALTERIGVDLCLGRGQELVGELVELCTRYPLRELLHAQLMLALAQAGRRSEALDVYTRVRAVLLEEAGVEPGPGLRAMQQALLRGCPLPNGPHSGHPAR
jgi:SARP family transcriptional regulator, regulator of embCAB operon